MREADRCTTAKAMVPWSLFRNMVYNFHQGDTCHSSWEMLREKCSCCQRAQFMAQSPGTTEGSLWSYTLVIVNMRHQSVRKTRQIQRDSKIWGNGQGQLSPQFLQQSERAYLARVDQVLCPALKWESFKNPQVAMEMNTGTLESNDSRWNSEFATSLFPHMKMYRIPSIRYLFYSIEVSSWLG